MAAPCIYPCCIARTWLLLADESILLTGSCCIGVPGPTFAWAAALSCWLTPPSCFTSLAKLSGKIPDSVLRLAGGVPRTTLSSALECPSCNIRGISCSASKSAQYFVGNMNTQSYEFGPSKSSRSPYCILTVSSGISLKTTWNGLG